MPPQSPDFTVPEAVTVPMLAVDRGGVVRGANPVLLHICGVELGRLIGAPLITLCHAPGAQEAALQTLQQAFERSTPIDGLALQLRSAGDAAWPVRVSARPHGDAVWLTVVDATQERRAERLDEMLNMAQQFGRLGVWERDVRTLQGRWDRHMHRFWGISADEPAPDFARATNYVVPDDRENLGTQFLESTRKAGNYSLHFRVLGADGVLRRLHSQWTVKNGADGAPERAVGVIMDDTDVWRLAETIDETHAQLELALQLGGIAIWRHDLANNRLYYDDQGWRILGMAPRPDGLTLAEVRAMIHPDDLPAVQAAMQRATQSSTPTDMEARYRHADGHWLDILTRRVTQRDANGQAIGFIGVALDVTERLREQRRLQDLTRRLELAASVAGVAIWSYNLDTGEAVWNAQMYALHGLDPRESAPDLPTYLHDYIPPEHRAMMGERARRITAEVQDRVQQGEMQIVRTRRRAARRVGAGAHPERRRWQQHAGQR